MAANRPKRSRARKRVVKVTAERAPQPAAEPSDYSALALMSPLDFFNLERRNHQIPKDKYLRDNVERALGGDWRVARSLLDQFVEEGPSANPVLVAYIAGRIDDWLAVDCDDRKARRSFRVARPPQRERTYAIQDKHIGVIEDYLVLRGEGLGRGDALLGAAQNVHLEVQTVDGLVTGLHDPKVRFTELQLSAICLILKRALQPDYSGPNHDFSFIRKCLGRGWDKWVAHMEFHAQFHSKELARLAKYKIT